MRKLTIILSLILLSWCCGAKVYASAPRCAASHTTQTEIDTPVTDELRCEREYNSDLGLPHSAAEMAPIQTTSVRTSSTLEKLGVKCGICCGRDGYKIDCLPEFTHNLLLAGADAVDYYVYRLRRLLI
ncbi:MAG: hypothetical protein RR996_07035 [Alistipes sp.]